MTLNIHKINEADCAIITWKDNFIALLYSTYDNLPLHLCDILIEPLTITLNMLHPCCWTLHMYGYTDLDGSFDFNKTILVSPGTNIIINKKLDQRSSWDAHGIDG